MNWGNKLLITFIIFGAGILYLVYRSMTTDFELVDHEYYKSELRYQEVIDGSGRANALSTVASLVQNGRQVILQLPAEMKNQPITGSILFYCAYNEKLDRQFALLIGSGGSQVFDCNKICPGNYMVKISWVVNGRNYYTEKPITIS